MEDEFGPNYITVEDDEGNEFELEHLDTMEFEGEEYMVFLPADTDVDDPDYGYIILQVVEQDGEEQFVSVDDEEKLQRVYEYYMELIFSDEEEPES
ncbi:MAG: DUF1292 domain-containing protein [Oscillospiraceae bacterium]|nr:DUF1292 domain-containing protein [Oscillospiraceae bacterium]